MYDERSPLVACVDMLVDGLREGENTQFADQFADHVSVSPVGRDAVGQDALVISLRPVCTL